MLSSQGATALLHIIVSVCILVDTLGTSLDIHQHFDKLIFVNPLSILTLEDDLF